MSEKQHAKDIQAIGNHVESGAADGSGGQCLNRHEGDVKKNDSCSHRWQAVLNARNHAGWYDWPAYKSLATGKTYEAHGGETLPSWYTVQRPAPTSFKVKVGRKEVEKGTWDLDHGTNFLSKCYDPYWHEAHHVIPNSILRHAILNVGKGAQRPMTVVWGVRKSLLQKKYNLNYQVNLILLPMDRPVGRALGLPVHRETAEMRSHSAYSKHVLDELDEIFAPVKQEVQECQKEKDFDAPKAALERYSGTLHARIRASGAEDLDAMTKDLFAAPQR